jgi:hypothetical protein
MSCSASKIAPGKSFTGAVLKMIAAERAIESVGGLLQGFNARNVFARSKAEKKCQLNLAKSHPTTNWAQV